MEGAVVGEGTFAEARRKVVETFVAVVEIEAEDLESISTTWASKRTMWTSIPTTSDRVPEGVDIDSHDVDIDSHDVGNDSQEKQWGSSAQEVYRSNRRLRERSARTCVIVGLDEPMRGSQSPGSGSPSSALRGGGGTGAERPCASSNRE